MKFREQALVRSIYILTLLFFAITCLSKACFAQGSGKPMQGSAQVSMTLYQLNTENDGKQYVVARDGSMVPLPAPGMALGASQVAIYGDKSGNYWYQAQNGNAVAIHDNRLTWNDSKSYAKDEKKSKRQKRKERRNGVLGSFLGAATGAALGTAMTNAAYGNYNGVPYGYPLYGTPNSMYYVGPNGTPVYINPTGANLNHLYSQWNTQQQLVQQNRLQYQNSAQQSALQFQQQAQQNSLNHQKQRHANNQAAQQNWTNARQQNLTSRQQLQQNRKDTNTGASATRPWKEQAGLKQEKRSGLLGRRNGSTRFGSRFGDKTNSKAGRWKNRFAGERRNGLNSSARDLSSRSNGRPGALKHGSRLSGSKFRDSGAVKFNRQGKTGGFLRRNR